MRITLMHNPTAGAERHSKAQLLSALREAGYDPVYQSMDEDDYPAALEAPGEIVVVAGGDGTVDKIAPHLVGRGIPIGILPLGTANNIATALGMRGTVRELIAGWKTARRQPYDVGVAQGPWGEERFIEAVGVGFFAQMMPVVDALRKRADVDADDREQTLRHDLDALQALLSDYRPQPWQLALDGEDLSGSYLLVEAMNVGVLGPRLCMAIDADPGDGCVDVVLIGEDEREALTDFLAGRLNGDAVQPPFTVRRGRHLQIQWNGSEVHVDSNLWAEGKAPFEMVNTVEAEGGGAIDVRLEHHALELLVPAT